MKNIVIFLLLLILIISLAIKFKVKLKSKEMFTVRKHTIQRFINRKSEVYKDILFKVAKVMNRLNIPFFLSSGTLLGYYREGKFLDHDYDVDIGIYNKDFTQDIFNEMKKEGFFNYRNLGKLDTGYEMSFYLRKSKIKKYAKIDIFVHNTETVNGKKMIYWSSYKRPDYKEQIKYRVSYFDIRPVFFYNIPVNIPLNTEKYLREHYGDNWRIPIKPNKHLGYYYATSPVSIVK